MRSKDNPGYINSMESLQAEKWALKKRLKEREVDFKERAAKLPVEVIKATAGKVIPFFLNRRVAAMSWMIIKGVSGLVFRRRGASAKPNKGSVFSSVKEWGFIALAKAAYGLFTKKA